MMIIGVDYHPSFQTVAFLMEETGECGEQELKHSNGEAERFYRDLGYLGYHTLEEVMRPAKRREKGLESRSTQPSS